VRIDIGGIGDRSIMAKRTKVEKGGEVFVALVSISYKKSGDFIEHTPMHIDDGKREEKRSNKNNVRRD